MIDGIGTHRRADERKKKKRRRRRRSEGERERERKKEEKQKSLGCPLNVGKMNAEFRKSLNVWWDSKKNPSEAWRTAQEPLNNPGGSSTFLRKEYPCFYRIIIMANDFLRVR